MRRNIDYYLEDWKIRSSRKPLIIRGARQVGKTWSVDTLSKSFAHVIRIDFEAERDAAVIFRDNRIERIIQELTLFTGVPAIDGLTLIFLDECQLCPEVLRSLRYFYEKRPGLHVIAAGSLLDITLNEMRYPMPVGRVEFLYMYPLNYNEFLSALGKDHLRQFIENYRLQDVEVSPAIHNQLLDLLRLYYFIGGMPEAVDAYARSEDLLTIQRIQTELVTSLQNDIAKYTEKKDQPHLLNVFSYVAQNTGRKIKYSNIDDQVRSSVLKSAVNYLEQARIIHKISHSHGDGIPLSAQEKPEHFKAAFLDVGLSNRICGLDLVQTSDMLTIREGMLAEQFAAQELAAANWSFEDRKLFYWIRQSKNSNAEVDFLFSAGNNVIPLEIKSGKVGTLKSLHLFMVLKKSSQLAVRCSLDIPSLVEANHQITIEKVKATAKYTLLNLPLYMVSQVKRIVREMG
jgi:uncharacterized protein